MDTDIIFLCGMCMCAREGKEHSVIIIITTILLPSGHYFIIQPNEPHAIAIAILPGKDKVQ